MSDQDTTVITEDSNETPKDSRVKTALNKLKIYAPYITTVVVVMVGGALIVQALDDAEEPEEDIVDGEVIVVETED